MVTLLVVVIILNVLLKWLNKESCVNLKNIKTYLENERNYKIILFISFSFFITVLLWFITFKANKFEHIIYYYKRLKEMTLLERFKYELKPFVFNNPYFDSKKEFIYNILIFGPFGIFLPLLFKNKSIKRDLIICFNTSLLLELIQLFTLIGGFSTNDLIANTLGYFLGYIIYKIIICNLNKRNIMIINFILIIFLLPIIIYMIVNTISNIDIYIFKRY